MLIKLLGKYVKFVVVFAIIGCVGVLAYLTIREIFVEDTTKVIVYEIGEPAKLENQSNPYLPRGHSRNKGDKTTETSGSSITSDTHLTYLDTGDVEGLDEGGEANLGTQDLEDLSADPQISAEGTLQNRQKYSNVKGYIVDRDELVRRFGDIPQVHTAYEYLQQGLMGEEKTVEEEITGIEALKYLYPELHTPAHEEFLQALKEDRVTFIGQSSSPDLYDALKALEGATLSPEMYEALKEGRLPLYRHQSKHERRF